MAVPDPRVGTVLQGRYKVLERRTEGSMGVVYRGERLAINRPVAIKFLSEGYAVTEDGRRRFEVEARAMSRLEHPNCVPVTDFGVDEGSPYLVMDYVNGRTLREMLVDEWRLPPARAVALVRQVLAGVAHAHAQGIIHRDLKPENVLVTPVEGHGEHARIVDFGLAKLRDDGSFTTGVAVGTPGYMSPEQTIGEKADERADVYACGIILYELLTGAKPFQSEIPFEVMRQHREVPPAPLATAADGVAISPRLEAVVMKALAKAREDRYQSASAFREALESVDEAGGADGARPGRTGRIVLVALGVAVLTIVGLVAALAGRGGGASAPASGSSSRAAAAGVDPGQARSAAAPAPAGTLPAVDAAEAPLDAAAVPPDAAAPADVAPAPTDPADVARLRKLAARRGGLHRAVHRLEALRRRHPDEPAVHHALGALYAREHAWSSSVKAYAAALRLAPGYRGDDQLCADVVAALADDDARELATAVIRNDLGAAARPALEEASRSSDATLRGRAAEVLSGLP
jgi:eukaryotic-like serine/threonine-protein kinase